LIFKTFLFILQKIA